MIFSAVYKLHTIRSTRNKQHDIFDEHYNKFSGISKFFAITFLSATYSASSQYAAPAMNTINPSQYQDCALYFENHPKKLLP